MARKLLASFDLAGSVQNVQKSMATALATLASGKNPDATAFYLPVANEAPLTATPKAAATAAELGVAATAGLRLMGYSIMESAGSPAAASVNLLHSADNTGAIVAPIKLAASGVQTVMFPEGGIAVANGIYINRLTGNTTVVLYTKVVA